MSDNNGAINRLNESIAVGTVNNYCGVICVALNDAIALRDELTRLRADNAQLRKIEAAAKHIQWELDNPEKDVPSHRWSLSMYARQMLREALAGEETQR